MRSYQGAVLFVDMLGFGDLTRGYLRLTADEYEPWKVDVESNAPHQLLAARLLLAFRKALTATKRVHEDAEIAQLSDCCFIWSRDLGCVLDAGRYFMENATLNGLLCRGGLAYGQIHEPEKVKRSLGAFIVGDAVTRAATLERTGKGTRIFADRETGYEVLKRHPNECFQPLTNPLTGEVVDEWRWYAPRGLLRKESNVKTIRNALSKLVRYHTTLRYSPKLAWSATTHEGCRQIACSIAAVSEPMEEISGKRGQFSFSVDVLLEAGMHGNRTEETQRKVHDIFVDNLIGLLKQSR